MYGLIGPGLFGLDFSFLARVSVLFPRSQAVSIKSILSSLPGKSTHTFPSYLDLTAIFLAKIIRCLISTLNGITNCVN